MYLFKSSVQLILAKSKNRSNSTESASIVAIYVVCPIKDGHFSVYIKLLFVKEVTKIIVNVRTR